MVLKQRRKPSGELRKVSASAAATIISPRSHRNQVDPHGWREGCTCVFMRGCVLERRWRRDGAISHYEVAQINVWTALIRKTKRQKAKREITQQKTAS